MFIKPITSGEFIQPLKSIFEHGEKKESGADLKSVAGSFSNALAKAVGEIKGMEDLSEQYSYEIAMGNTENLETAMINTAKLNSTVQLATTITSRVVSTYKEILAMQI